MLKTILGDITNQEKVELICNAANGLGLMCGGVSRSIGKKAGMLAQIYAMKNALMSAHLAGTIYTSPPGNLRCSKIVHLVTMYLPGTWSRQATIESCLKKLIQYCRQNNYKEVMLPFIGSGTGMVNHKKVIDSYYEILSKEKDITFIVCDKNKEMINQLNIKICNKI